MNLTALEAGTPIGAGASAFCAAIPRSTNVSKQKLSVFLEQERHSFGVGYVANFAHMTTLSQRDNLLILDFLVHANLHLGTRAGSGPSFNKPP